MHMYKNFPLIFEDSSQIPARKKKEEEENLFHTNVIVHDHHSPAMHTY